ncbi:S1C family serine protease [Lachnospiraceae bacterium SGI.085]
MDNWNENNFDQNNNQNPYQQPADSYQQSANQTYSAAGQQDYTYQNNPYSQKAPKEKKPKRSGGNGFGAKLAKCVAIALVFGLVAGAAFTGVSYFGGNALGINQSSDSSDKSSRSSKDSDSSSSSSSDTAKTLATTSTGDATDVTDVSGIVDAVMPSIVAITNTGIVQSQNFFGQSQSYESQSAGSGIIIQEDDTYLYIATNNHVVEGAESLTVQFCDDSTVSAEVKGTDASHDLAVVKVEKSAIDSDTLSAIKVATIGDSTALKVGQATIAIGNALGYGQSVTTGVVSALGRTVSTSDSSTGTTVTNDNLIQTDAAINPGNSGGALLNTNGEVIGINSVKYSDTSVEGIGYAIPMEDAQPIISQLITQEKVDESKQAYLGIQGYDVSSDVAKTYNMPQGVYVYQVLSGSAAEKAGLQQGDIITKFDGKSVGSMEELQETLSYYEAGQSVKITICSRANNYQEQELDITLGSRN